MRHTCDRRLKVFILLATVSCVFLPACSNTLLTPVNPGPAAANTPVAQSPSIQVTASPTTQLQITTPISGDYVSPGALVVSVKVTNFSLVARTGGPNTAGEGHIIYFLDADAPTDPGRPAFTEPGTYGSTSAVTYIWLNVQPGTHMLSAELVNNDNTPLNPPVVTKTDIIVNSQTIPPVTC